MSTSRKARAAVARTLRNSIKKLDAEVPPTSMEEPCAVCRGARTFEGNACMRCDGTGTTYTSLGLAHHFGWGRTPPPWPDGDAMMRNTRNPRR